MNIRPAAVPPPVAAGAASPAIGAPALDVDGVGLTFPTSRGPLVALRNVSLSVSAGEFVSILGPSGCGKSSLLRLAAGLVAPTEGRLFLSGVPVTAPSPKVGVVFQQPALLPWRTVLGNVLVPVRALGLDRAYHRRRAGELLELVGLRDFARHYPAELSGGMRQRAGIARGLIHDPAILLMDEPFAALDQMTRERMMGELRRIWRTTGKSVLFITHSIAEAVFLSDRIVVMSPRPGRVADQVVVDLPRERALDILEDPAFVSISARLRATFDRLSTEGGR